MHEFVTKALLNEVDPTGGSPLVCELVDAAFLHNERTKLIESTRARKIADATDVMIWTMGEPQSRCVSKIGGIPFWPKERPWPQVDGTQLPFLFQVCFTDSSTLFDCELPGDMLVVFGSDSYEIESFQGQWLQTCDYGLSDLIQQIPERAKEDAVNPNTGEPQIPLHCKLWRTWSVNCWLNSTETIESLFREPPEFFTPGLAMTASTRGSQIGPSPFVFSYGLQFSPDKRVLGSIAQVRLRRTGDSAVDPSTILSSDETRDTMFETNELQTSVLLIVMNDQGEVRFEPA